MMGVLTDQLAGISGPRQRARVKTQAMAALSDMVGKSVTRGRFTVTLTGLSLHPQQDLLQFSLSVVDNNTGRDVTPTDLNPIRVYNPPILVADPAGEVVRSWTDPKTKRTVTQTFREDLRESLLSIVRDLAQQRLG